MKQGGLIGHHLFIIQINDISREVDIQKEVNLLADDAKMLSKQNNALQLTLDITYKWLNTRKLKLNPNKCQTQTNLTKANLTLLISYFVKLIYTHSQYLKT